ncbi:hypothetical protein BH10ACI4_BH10ACI4_28290 [soil metagenome]
MQTTYILVAEPFLLTEGEFKGHLETVTFIATSGTHSFKWWSLNVGKYVKDFQRIVSPELAKHIVDRLRQGETVEFPNRYDFAQVKGGFGGSYGD